MKVWTLNITDTSGCYYEGDTPVYTTKLFSTKEKAEAYIQKILAARKKRWRGHCLDWDIEELSIDDG